MFIKFTGEKQGGDGARSYTWYEVGPGAIAGETGPSLDIYVTQADTGRQFYVEATDAYAQTLTSATTTLSISGTAVADATLGGQPPSAPGRDTPTQKKAHDWASLVAAAEGDYVLVEDYIFSGRTFTRTDILRNER